uniref:Uncharacterized protein n=1 Tax=Anguilla anguilla TaxID=7936 RepID=A0A0E9XLW8_ANGAN
MNGKTSIFHCLAERTIQQQRITISTISLHYLTKRHVY